MVRFAEILKNNQKNAEAKSNPKPKTDNASAVKENVSLKECAGLYTEALNLAKNIFKEGFDPGSVNLKQISSAIEKIILHLENDTQGLLSLAYTQDSYSTDKNYLVAHAVNTCIYSLVLGLALGYDKQQLAELGLVSFLHDLGLVKHIALVNNPARINREERNKIHNHPEEGEDILRSISQDLPTLVYEALLQHHERIDGSGYPAGLRTEMIHQYAKIIGLVDVYEAMIHPRAFREKQVPFDAMQHILKNKTTFEYKLMKILIEKIGIFPVGSLVELSDKQIARVVRLNQDSPMRPVVEIIYNSQGGKLIHPEFLDLSVKPNISIKRAIRSKIR